MPNDRGTEYFPSVTLTGDARSRGQQHGEFAREQIRDSTALYNRWLSTYAGVEPTRALTLAEEYSAAIFDYFPELSAEIQGIAEGAGVEPLAVVVLNCRTEIAYGASGLLAGPSDCTSFGVEASRTRHGGTMVGQNWDWLERAMHNAILCHAVLEDGTEFLTLTEAGMLAKIGTNSHGIALCANMLAASSHQMGVPFHVLARAVLGANSFTSALGNVTRARRAGSGNFLLGNRHGEVVDLEWSPTDYAVLVPRDGIISHANHFEVQPRVGVDRTKLLSTASPGTYLRGWRLRRALEECESPIDVETAKHALRDHRDLPEGICRHGSSGLDDVFGQTNASVIIDLSSDTMHLTKGPPCRQEYQPFPLPWTVTQ